MAADRGWAQAVAITDGRIVFVGSNDDAASHIGGNTSVTDLGGRMMLPAFQDSHIHPIGAGIEAFIAPQWSIKGEYLYRSLGSENYFGVRSGDLNLHSVQFGVNYHFGGPILAKY